ncbi:MAG: hypothetical protein ABI045_03915 [Flavobacteriales bacterium]
MIKLASFSWSQYSSAPWVSAPIDLILGRITLLSITIITLSISVFPLVEDLKTFWGLFIVESVNFTFMLPINMKIFSEKIQNEAFRQDIIS